MISEDDLIIHMRHVRGAKLCAKGARKWFQENGLDWSTFLTSGLSAKRLRATGSALCERAISVAQREAANGQ